MVDVSLPFSPLLAFHTVKYVEWQWVINDLKQMGLLPRIFPHSQSMVHMWMALL